jgi:hypothetical protein
LGVAILKRPEKGARGRPRPDRPIPDVSDASGAVHPSASSWSVAETLLGARPTAIATGATATGASTCELDRSPASSGRYWRWSATSSTQQHRAAIRKVRPYDRGERHLGRRSHRDRNWTDPDAGRFCRAIFRSLRSKAASRKSCRGWQAAALAQVLNSRPEGKARDCGYDENHGPRIILHACTSQGSEGPGARKREWARGDRSQVRCTPAGPDGW